VSVATREATIDFPADPARHHPASVTWLTGRRGPSAGRAPREIIKVLTRVAGENRALPGRRDRGGTGQRIPVLQID